MADLSEARDRLMDETAALRDEIRDLEEQRRPLIVASPNHGIPLHGSMEPKIACLDSTTWLDNARPMRARSPGRTRGARPASANPVEHCGRQGDMPRSDLANQVRIAPEPAYRVLNGRAERLTVRSGRGMPWTSPEAWPRWTSWTCARAHRRAQALHRSRRRPPAGTCFRWGRRPRQRARHASWMR